MTDAQSTFYDRLLQCNRELPVMQQKCLQCWCPMGPEIFLGVVCGRCVRVNHRRWVG